MFLELSKVIYSLDVLVKEVSINFDVFHFKLRFENNTFLRKCQG